MQEQVAESGFGLKVVTRHCRASRPIFLLAVVLLVVTVWIPAVSADHAAAVNDVRDGNADYFDGDFPAAEIHFTNAITNDPTWALAFNNRGLARYHQGAFASADSDFDQAKALSTSPYASAFLNKGKSLAAQRRFSEAVTELQAGVAIAPDNASFYYNLGWVYDEQHAYTNAISHYTTALEKRANHHKARIARGIAYAKQGSSSNAVTDFYYVINNADDGDMLRSLAAHNLQILRGTGIDFDNDSAAANYTEGVFQWSVQQYDTALTVLAAAQSSEADVAEIPWMSFWCHLGNRETDEASVALGQARALMETLHVSTLSFPSDIFIDGIRHGATPAELRLFTSRFDITLRGHAAGDEIEWVGVTYTDGTPGGTNTMSLLPDAVADYTLFGPVADSDQDWLADTWETKWFGNLSQGPQDDPDNDGEINLHEHWWGGGSDCPG